MSLITWNMAEVMKTRGIQAGKLAAHMKVSSNTVTNWRKPTMPQLNGKRLNEILISLNQLRRCGGLIGPGDLISFSLTEDEMNAIGVRPM